jgi:Ca-activated chloride channel family protein
VVGLLVTVVAALLAIVGEWLHARRIRRVARLAFGPRERSRRWTRLVAPLRVAAIAATAWGFWTLWDFRTESAAETSDDGGRHLVVALDVSPSMHLADAGPQSQLSRGDRARDVLRSIFERIDTRRTRVSIIAFYTDAKPVVVDSFDPEVIANVLADLPLEQVFTGGKTNLYSGVKTAAELAKPWRERSATLLVVSDGDTLPAQAIPKLPAAIGPVLVLGVGNPRQGTFIDGHSSRQDAATLERLALQLNGHYRDVNSRHLPSDQLASLTMNSPIAGQSSVDWQQLAITAVVAGSTVLAMLPMLLAWWGGVFRPDRAAQAENSPYEPDTIRARGASTH